MIEIIPTIVAGGVVKKFSDVFLGKPSETKKRVKKRAVKAKYPTNKYSPF